MKWRQQNDDCVIVLKRGEEVISTLTQFVTDRNIHAASLTGIGAVDNPVLSAYDVHEKKYTARELKGEFELVSLTGNITLKDGRPFAHVHCVVSNIDMHSFGGHLNQCTVAATVEIFLKIYPEPLTRIYDNETGLFLITP